MIVPPNRIPVLLVTGFLGSGKSTLVNALVRQPALVGSVVIVNEFGQVGIDHHLIATLDERLVLLDSGCLCCAVHGDLVARLRELFQRSLAGEIAPIRVVIVETSGLADVAPLIHSLQADFFLAQRYVLAGVSTLVDVTEVERQMASFPEAVAQVAQADLLLLTRTDRVEVGEVARVREYLEAFNPLAPVVEAPFGRIEGERLLGLRSVSGLRFRPLLPARAVCHTHGVSAAVLSADEPLPWGAFTVALDRLLSAQGAALLRIKGRLNVRELPGPRVVQAVHHRRYPNQDQADWDAGERPCSHLVVIGRDLADGVVEAAFAGMLAPLSVPMEDH